MAENLAVPNTSVYVSVGMVNLACSAQNVTV